MERRRHYTYSDIAALKTEISQPSLPKETGKAQVFQSASSPPINVSNPYSKDMEIADALATKVRDRLLSEINGLAWRTFLLPVSAYALFYFIVYLATSLSAPAENGLEKLCNCSNTATLQRPLNSTLPTLISETEIWHKKALPLTTEFFYVLVCYNTIIVLLMFRTIHKGISSKIDMGMTLLKCHIGNNQYQYVSDQPLGIHQYTQYSGLMQPDPCTWKPKTTFYKGGWSNLAWVVGGIDLSLLLITLVPSWVAHTEGTYSEGSEYVLSYVIFSTFGLFGLAMAAVFGTEIFTIERQRLDISRTVASDEKVVWGLCDEIWMGMGMDTAKLRSLSKVVGVWESGVGIM